MVAQEITITYLIVKTIYWKKIWITLYVVFFFLYPKVILIIELTIIERKRY